jgi:glycosyltransferase involved in cell wall biosynthesis
MTRHVVAIYAPFSRGYYDHSRGRAGGAERQMMLLGHALAARGIRVAHIVFEPREPIDPPSHLTLIYRRDDAGDRSIVGGALEAARIWRALHAAHARIVVVRTATPALGIVALFCKLRGRRLIFSSASNSNFTEEAGDRSYSGKLYRLGVRLADIVVVQSQDQVTLARRAFPRLRHVVHIPSFCETSGLSENDANEREAFLWIGRLAPKKRPLRYVDLARAVPDASFIMIPIQERRMSGELQELRDAAEDVPNLEILEPVPHAELMALISRAVAVVNTSSLEGMPNVFLEAWARGVPALSLEFDPDGVIAQRELGVVAGGSWDRFVAGTHELWEGRSRRDELARRTRAYVDEVHSIDAVAARWSQVIASVGRNS